MSFHIDEEDLPDLDGGPQATYVLVTAITPTPLGEGKTTGGERGCTRAWWAREWRGDPGVGTPRVNRPKECHHPWMP